MNDAPLMPMATAVWLVENTTLTFKQIAEFCKLHEVEIQGIADGEVAKGIVGYNPIISGQLSKEEIDNYFDILYNGNNENRVWIHAHFGTNSIEDIFSKIRYMIVGCGCKWIVVDHLHMLVSAMYEGDERRAIDAIMTKLRSICEETGAGMSSPKRRAKPSLCTRCFIRSSSIKPLLSSPL